MIVKFYLIEMIKFILRRNWSERWISVSQIIDMEVEIKYALISLFSQSSLD